MKGFTFERSDVTMMGELLRRMTLTCSERLELTTFIRRMA